MKFWSVGLVVLSVAGAPAWADSYVHVETSGSGGQDDWRWAEAQLERSSAKVGSQFDTWRPGPGGGADEATGYNYGAMAWGEAGPGYLRAGAHMQMLASGLDYGNRPLAVARTTSSAYFRDVTFSGAEVGTPVSTKLRMNLSGTGTSWMGSTSEAAPLNGAWDNSYGSINFSVYVTDVTDSRYGVEVAEFSGQWTWSWDQIGYEMDAPWGQVGWGTGLLENWTNAGQFLEMPFDVQSGHKYQIAMALTVETRAETDGWMQAISDGLFNHSAVLDATPFDLPAGVTVDSTDAAITGNVFAGAPAPLPEPAGAGVIAAGLLGFARRQRSRTPATRSRSR